MDGLRSVAGELQEAALPFYLRGSESDFKNNGHVKVNFNLLAACGAEAGTVSCERGGDVPQQAQALS